MIIDVFDRVGAHRRVGVARVRVASQPCPGLGRSGRLGSGAASMPTPTDPGPGRTSHGRFYTQVCIHKRVYNHASEKMVLENLKVTLGTENRICMFAQKMSPDFSFLAGKQKKTPRPSLVEGFRFPPRVAASAGSDGGLGVGHACQLRLHLVQLGQAGFRLRNLALDARGDGLGVRDARGPDVLEGVLVEPTLTPIVLARAVLDEPLLLVRRVSGDPLGHGLGEALLEIGERVSVALSLELLVVVLVLVVVFDVRELSRSAFELCVACRCTSCHFWPPSFAPKFFSETWSRCFANRGDGRFARCPQDTWSIGRCQGWRRVRARARSTTTHPRTTTYTGLCVCDHKMTLPWGLTSYGERRILTVCQRTSSRFESGSQEPEKVSSARGRENERNGN